MDRKAFHTKYQLDILNMQEFVFHDFGVFSKASQYNV